MQAREAATKRRLDVTDEQRRDTLARIVGILLEDAERHKREQQAPQAR